MWYGMLWFDPFEESWSWILEFDYDGYMHASICLIPCSFILRQDVMNAMFFEYFECVLMCWIDLLWIGKVLVLIRLISL